jgi:hypothetical protein
VRAAQAARDRRHRKQQATRPTIAPTANRRTSPLTLPR